MKLAGIDLAWTENNPTGLAFGEVKDRTLTVTKMKHGVMSPKQICSEVTNEQVCGVSVDAPLIIQNQSGMRECERSIGREFGSRKASCMPSNLSKYPSHPAVELAKKLELKGYTHVESEKSNGKWQIECYPHPAIINLFGLRERLRYKKKRAVRVSDQRYGQAHLGWLLRSLSSSPVLKLNIPNHIQIEHFSFDREHNLSGKELKAHEDKLDAVICLYVAALHAISHTDLHGSLIDGYIVIPQPHVYLPQEKAHEGWQMAPWAVEIAHNYYLVAMRSWGIDGLVSMTNAVLALEIVLKSYLLNQTKNLDALNQRYEMMNKVGDGHDLSKLLDALPASIQRRLAQPFEREMIHKYRNFFKESRYGYETNALTGSNQTLHTVAGGMIRKTVEIYRKRGCEDPWIKNFK